MQTTYELVRDLKLKSGQIIQSGTEFSIIVAENTPTIAQLTSHTTGQEIAIKSINLHKYFDEFQAVTWEDIEEAATDCCICPSLTGESVEPDGWDEHGFPSILQAAGLV